MQFTQVIRSNNEEALRTRRRGLINAGVQVSLMTMEPGEYDVYTFDAYLDSDTAHQIERRDDRWAIANQFFQAAEQAESKRGWYAILANDWSSFDYQNSTLAEYLDLEHARQLALQGV